jgi:hypothetical protein
VSDARLGRRNALVGLAGLGLAGCSGGLDTSPLDPRPMKISYFRAYPDPKTKKLEATYKVVMSNGWKERMGEGPREPFPKAAPGKIYSGFVTDRELARVFELLEDNGLGKLKARTPEEYRPELLYKQALDPEKSAFTRIFTVGTDKGHKSYAYADHHLTDRETFAKCETIVSRICEHSMWIKTSTEPLAPK